MAGRRAPPGGTSLASSSEAPNCQTDNRLKYTLSKKQKIPPFQLSARGHWSTWPAFASGQTVLQNHKPCCVPKERKSSNKQALLTIPKPRYLEQLESYLRKELQSLDLTKKNSQELKLQPYREIFEFFIDSFKTYKPLLSAIKNEYEVTLAHQKEMIRALEPLKAMVTTVSEEYTQQILALQEKERVEINMLKQEKQHLLKFIDSMKEEKSSLEIQVEHLQKSLAEEYVRYLNEYHARKLLLANMNEMHNEQLGLTLHQVQDVKSEDVVKLTLALKIARQDLTKAQVELNRMIADYGDVVPRRDFESLEKKYSDLLQKMKTQQKDFDQLHKEYDMLLEIHRETAEERDNAFIELQEVQRGCTPRPNWAKCSEVIPGGGDRWSSLAEGKTSDQLVDMLLEEIGTGVLKEREVFLGWGKGDNVPVYLRYEGEIKNKKLSKKDVVTILKDVWREKNALEQQTGKRSSLPEFFLSYLQKKYGDAAAMEWSYTIYENMRLYQSNHVMSSFYDILTGKVGEEQYHGQNQLISNLQKELAACDSLNTGSLTSEQFSMAVREVFPLKRTDSIQELIDASRYKLDSAEDLINYRSLFSEDEEGNAEPFIAMIRNQYVSEKQEYLRELKSKLGDLIEVNADDLKTAFCAIDPDIDDQTLDIYIGLAYQVGKEQTAQDVLPVETALERLLAGDVRRVGPSPKEESKTDCEEDAVIFPLRGVNERKAARAARRPRPAAAAAQGPGPAAAEAPAGGAAEDVKPIDLTVQVELGPGAPAGPGPGSGRLPAAAGEEGPAEGGPPDHSYSLSSGTTSEELLRKLNEQRDIIALLEVKMKEMKGSIRRLRLAEAQLREEIREKDRLLHAASAGTRKRHGL